MKYRAEIDGLRAVAVVPVILFHAGFETFSGGYVGVDIFFVISGYLITTIILKEKDDNKFSVINFYERRARRILPALFFVMLACLPPAWFWLLPQEMENFSKSLAASSLFSSNILFWRISGYFDTAAEYKPLIHTWSLSVEEQFYLLVPLFFIIFWRFGKLRIFGLLVVAFIVSLTIAVWGSIAHPNANFYLLPARAWELLGGALIAFYPSKQKLWVTSQTHGYAKTANQYLSEFAAAVGILLIICAVLLFDRRVPSPSLYTLVPVGGTILIILYAHEGTLVGRLLGNRLLVGIGLISFSAYLWHQPLFAFARNKGIQDPDQSMLGSLALVSLGLAYISWRFVEQPFRNKDRITGKQVLVFGLSGTMIFLIVGTAGYLSNGFDSRLPPNIAWQSLGAKREKQGDVCRPVPNEDYPGVLSCRFGDRTSSRSILLYGDSHSLAISEELDNVLLANNIEGIMTVLDGCETVPQIHNTDEIVNLDRDCVPSFKNLLSFIEETESDIVVASRWTFKLFPIRGEIEDMPSANSEGGKERSIIYREYAVMENGNLAYDADAKRKAVDYFVNGLLSTKQKLYFVYPIPEISWDIARLNVDHYRKYDSVLDEISIPYTDFKNRNRFVNDTFRNFEQKRNFIPIVPEKIFCDTVIKGRCAAQFKSIPYYYDDDHLSNAGARLVVKNIMAQIAQADPIDNDHPE